MHPLHHYGWSDLRALRAGRYKLIDAPRPELYDLELDPKELTNLYGLRRQVADGMLGRLRALEAAFDRSSAAAPELEVDPEARERLAALGYVSGFVATAAEPRSGRADPKDRIAIFAKAEELFRKALALDARVAQATVALGVVAAQRGDMAGAERLAREALDARADVALAHYNLALIAEARGDRATAEREYAEELRLHPDSYQAAFNLSLIYESTGRRQQQIEALKQAIESNPRFAEGHIVLAKDLSRRRDEPRRGGETRAEAARSRAAIADGAVGTPGGCGRRTQVSVARGLSADAERAWAVRYRKRVVMRYGFALVAVLLVLAGDPPRAQEPPQERPGSQPLRVGTTGVLVDVVVRDKKGRPVSGLTAEDFELFEDGVRQDIITVTEPAIAAGDEQGSRGVASVAPRPGPGTSTAPDPAAGLSFTALVFERLSPEGRALAYQAALTQVERRRGPGEYTGVFVSDLSLLTLQPYTNDAEKLRRAVDAAASRATSRFRPEQEMNPSATASAEFSPAGA